MVRHKSFLNGSQKRRNDYLSVAIISAVMGDHEESTLETNLQYLLKFGKCDPNTMHDGAIMNPMHMSIMLRKIGCLRILMHHGGDVHRKLRLYRQLHQVGGQGDHVTPLQFAMETRLGPASLIEEILDWSPLEALSHDPNFGLNSVPNQDIASDPMDVDGIGQPRPLNFERLSASYASAACKGLEPGYFRVLFGGNPSRLDLNLRDINGKTPLAMLCEALTERFVTPGRDDINTAKRSVACARELLRLGADVSAADIDGVTPLDRALGIMQYDGDDSFLQEASRAWNESFVVVGSTLQAIEGDAGDDAVDN